MKKIVPISFILCILLSSCFGPKVLKSNVDKSLSGTEVDFKKMMNIAFAKDYIDADVITYVIFYDANPNKMEFLKIPKNHLAFQVIPLNGSAKPNALGGGEGGYHVFIPKDLGEKVFDLKKGDKLKLRGGTHITKIGGFGTTTKNVNFKATSMELIEMLNETPPPARTDENTGNSKDSNAKSKQDSIHTTNRHKFQLGKTYLNDLSVPSNYSGINRFQVEYSYLKKFDKLLGLEIAAGLTTSYRKEKVSGQSLREHVLYVMPKLNFDIVNKNKFNLFANAGLGFGLDSYTSKLSTNSEKTKSRSIRFLYDINVGVNYFVNDYFGLTASAGFPTTMFKIGIVKRIK